MFEDEIKDNNVQHEVSQVQYRVIFVFSPSKNCKVQTMSDFSGEDDERHAERDRESITSVEVPINDLEKSNAVVAAFTVVGIFSLFFIEIGLTVVFMVIITNGDQLNERIAHSEFVMKGLEDINTLLQSSAQASLSGR